VKALNGGEVALTWKRTTMICNTVVGITVRVIYRSHPNHAPSTNIPFQVPDEVTISRFKLGRCEVGI